MDEDTITAAERILDNLLDAALAALPAPPEPSEALTLRLRAAVRTPIEAQTSLRHEVLIEKRRGDEVSVRYRLEGLAPRRLGARLPATQRSVEYVTTVFAQTSAPGPLSWPVA